MKTVEEIKEKIEKLKIELNNLPRTPIDISVLTNELISTIIVILNWVIEDSEDVKEEIK